MALKMSRKMWTRILLLIGVAIVGGFLYYPVHTNYADRALVAVALNEQVELRRQIEAELLQGKPSAALASLQRTADFTRVVSRDGIIVLYVPKISTTVVLTPAVIGNEVKWSCSGDVMRNLPDECRKSLAESVLPLARQAKNADQLHR